MINKLIILIISLFIFPALAKNITQFTGGNYVYADNDTLIFNLEPDLFEARDWKYDAGTDSFTASFNTNELTIKTRYTSEFVPYTNAPNARFIPALVAGARVAGAVGRYVFEFNLKEAFIFCAKNYIVCSIPAAVGATCKLVAYLNMESAQAVLPEGVCKNTEADGFHRDKENNYVRYRSYTVKCRGGVCTSHPGGSYGTFSAALGAAKAACPSDYNSYYGHASLSGVSDNGTAVFCDYTVDGQPDNHYSAVYGVEGVEKKETLQMVDLSRYVADDAKIDPKPYLNDPGEIGKQLRKQVQLKEASLSNSGTFSVIGTEPYRNPETGKTVQDVVTIDPPKMTTGGFLSGNAESHTSGQSSVNNHVSITHIDREDVAADSKPGKPNKPNGVTGSAGVNNGGSGSGSSSGSNPGSSDGKDDKDGERCKPNDKTVGCMPVGDLPEETDIAVPVIAGSDFILSIDAFLPTDGVCPQPIILAVGHYSVKIDYEPMCTFAQKIRMLVELMGALTAAFIIFRSNI